MTPCMEYSHASHGCCGPGATTHGLTAIGLRRGSVRVLVLACRRKACRHAWNGAIALSGCLMAHGLRPYGLPTLRLGHNARRASKGSPCGNASLCLRLPLRVSPVVAAPPIANGNARVPPVAAAAAVLQPRGVFYGPSAIKSRPRTNPQLRGIYLPLWRICPREP